MTWIRNADILAKLHTKWSARILTKEITPFTEELNYILILHYWKTITFK